MEEERDSKQIHELFMAGKERTVFAIVYTLLHREWRRPRHP